MCRFFDKRSLVKIAITANITVPAIAVLGFLLDGKNDSVYLSTAWFFIAAAATGLGYAQGRMHTCQLPHIAHNVVVHEDAALPEAAEIEGQLDEEPGMGVALNDLRNPRPSP